MKHGLAIPLVLILTMTFVVSKPAATNLRQKRQSDQRIAELETLLALQKYGHHRLHDWGKFKEMGPPGYGLIDFDKIGRRKKSTRFSPGGEENTAWNTWMGESLDRRHPIASSSTSSGSLESQTDQTYIK